MGVLSKRAYETSAKEMKTIKHEDLMTLLNTALIKLPEGVGVLIRTTEGPLIILYLDERQPEVFIVTAQEEYDIYKDGRLVIDMAKYLSKATYDSGGPSEWYDTCTVDIYTRHNLNK